MPTIAAGLLLYRKKDASYQVLLVHPGGPFWSKKDDHAWSIPKGGVNEGEDLLTAAKREFTEEIGSMPPPGDYIALQPVTYGSKTVHSFALASDFDLTTFKSNTFEMQWPPKSGTTQVFPENDKAAWVPVAAALQKLVKGQVPIIEQLMAMLGVDTDQIEGNQASLF